MQASANAMRPLRLCVQGNGCKRRRTHWDHFVYVCKEMDASVGERTETIVFMCTRKWMQASANVLRPLWLCVQGDGCKRRRMH